MPTRHRYVHKNLIKIATCQSESNWFGCSCFLPRNSRIKWYSNGIYTNEMSFNLNLIVRCVGYANEIHLNRFTLWRNLFRTLHLFECLCVFWMPWNWLKGAMCQAITSILHLTPRSWKDCFPRKSFHIHLHMKRFSIEEFSILLRNILDGFAHISVREKSQENIIDVSFALI